MSEIMKLEPWVNTKEIAEHMGVTVETVRKRIKLEKHISQEILSEMLGITPIHIKHIESEHRKPSVDVLYRLTRVLNISLDDIFFPECLDRNELSKKVQRLLGECDEKQIKILLATLEAMLAKN